MSEPINPVKPDQLELPWVANGSESAQALEKRLSEDPALRDELEFLKRLRSALQRDPEHAPDDLAWGRFKQSLGVERRMLRRGRWWRVAAVAASVLVLIQAGMLLESGTFAPLSGDEPNGAMLQVNFVPQATEAQLRAALQAAGATVVDGPGAVGIYRARVEGDAGQAAEYLRAQTGVVAEVIVDQ
jgi:hypothetical protein